MRKILMSICLIVSTLSFSDLYGNDSKWKYDKNKLYDKFSGTIISDNCNGNDECYIKTVQSSYIKLLKNLNKELKKSDGIRKLSKEEKEQFDNIYIAQFDINWLEKISEYKEKKALGYGEASIHRNIEYLDTPEAYYKFLYSFKQYVKGAKTFANYAKLDKELRNDEHYLWLQPFEWTAGTGVPVE